MKTRSRSSTATIPRSFTVKRPRSSRDFRASQYYEKPYSQSIADDLSSNDRSKQLYATKYFCNLLVAKGCAVAAGFILEDGLFDKFDEFLHFSDSTELLYNAARAIILTIINAWMVNEETDDRRAKILLKLLDLPEHPDYPDLQQQVVRALEYVTFSHQGRELVHKHDAVHILVAKGIFRKAFLHEGFLKTATRTLLRFCKSKHSPGAYEEYDPEPKTKGKGKVSTHFYRPVASCKAPHLDKVKEAFPDLCFIIQGAVDDDVLTDACSTLLCLSDRGLVDYTPVDFDRCTCRRLVELLKEHCNSSRSFGAPALSIIVNIALRDDQSKLLLDADIIPCLKSLLCSRKDESVVCIAIRNMTYGKGRKEQIEAVIRCNLIDPMVKLVENFKENCTAPDAIGKGEMALRAIRSCISGGTSEQIKEIKMLIGPWRLSRLNSLLRLDKATT